MAKPSAKNVMISFWLMVALAILVLYLIVFQFSKIQDVFERTEIVKYDDLQESLPFNGLLVRNETLFAMNGGGKVDYLQSEGTKVRHDVRILQLAPLGKETTMPADIARVKRLAGTGLEVVDAAIATKTRIVSYRADGLEKIITLKKIESMPINNLARLNGKVVNLRRGIAAPGQPLYKLVDNNVWHVCLVVKTRGAIRRYQQAMDEGNNLAIEIDDISYEAKIYSIQNEPTASKIILESNIYFRDLNEARRISGKVVFSENSGLKCKRSALVRRGGQDGLFVKGLDDLYHWTPIKVISYNSSDMLVESGNFIDADGNQLDTINSYQEVLVNPQGVPKEKLKEK